MYAEIDGFDPTKYTLDYDKLSVMDKWLLSRMNTMIASTDKNLENYRIPEAASALETFVDEMSRRDVQLVCAPLPRPLLG